MSARRDTATARRFFANAIAAHGEPTEVTTDKAHALAVALRAVVPEAWHDTAQYANNRIESDRARLKARLRPMRGLKRDHTAAVVITRHAFIQNLRRGHYELGTYARRHLTMAAAFDELTAVV
ncbi:MAG: DDE-type integrase/transposase/recombinase [Acidimicrobiales bacterium]